MPEEPEEKMKMLAPVPLSKVDPGQLFSFDDYMAEHGNNHSDGRSEEELRTVGEEAYWKLAEINFDDLAALSEEIGPDFDTFLNIASGDSFQSDEQRVRFEEILNTVVEKIPARRRTKTMKAALKGEAPVEKPPSEEPTFEEALAEAGEAEVEAGEEVKKTQARVAAIAGEGPLQPQVVIPRIEMFRQAMKESTDPTVVQTTLENIDAIEKLIEIVVDESEVSDKQKKVLKEAAIKDIRDLVSKGRWDAERTVCVRDGDGLTCYVYMDLDTDNIKVNNVLLSITNLQKIIGNNLVSFEEKDGDLEVESGDFGPVNFFVEPDDPMDIALFEAPEGEFLVYGDYVDGVVYTGLLTAEGPEIIDQDPTIEGKVAKIVVKDGGKVTTWKNNLRID